MTNPFLIGMIVPSILLLIMQPLAWQYRGYIRLELVLGLYFLTMVLLLGLTTALLIGIVISIVFLLLLEPILWRALYLARHPSDPLSGDLNRLPALNIGQVKTYTMIIPRLLYWSYASKGWTGNFFYWNFHYRARLWETIVATKPATLSEIDEKTLVGQHITAFDDQCGSYGTGGPGFFGITLSGQPLDQKILVYAIWGADNYMLLDGRVVRSYFLPPKGMQSEKDTFALMLVGAQITDIQLVDDRCTLHLIQDEQPHMLVFTKNDKRLIPHPQNQNLTTDTGDSANAPPEGMPRKNAFETGAVADYLVFQNEYGVLWV